MLVRRAVQVLGSALVLVSMSLVASPSAAEEPVDVDKRSWCTTDSRPFLHYAFAGGLYPENAEPPYELREWSSGELVAAGTAKADVTRHNGPVEIPLPALLPAGQYLVSVAGTGLDLGSRVEAFDCVTAEVACEQLTFTNPSTLAARVDLYGGTSPDASVVVPAGRSTAVPVEPGSLAWIALPHDDGHVVDEMGSGAVDVPACASLTATPEPVVTGQPRLGATLRAVPGSWQPAPVALTYRWLRNGAPIARATSLTYRPTRADLGAHLSFQVTGRKTDHRTSVQVSSDTPRIQWTSWASWSAG